MEKHFKYDDFNIDFKNPLGRGGNGSVYKATDKEDKVNYAIKRIPINSDLREEEINHMIDMNKYENSVKYYGCFKYQNYIYLVMELCDCSLDVIIKEKKLNIKEIKELLEQLNNVFKIMHNKSIIHRDIKPENILIKKLENNKCLYKLADYGLSKLLSESHKASTFVGTKDYIAPEIQNNLDIDKSKVDLWSIGILIHKLYFGNTPKNNNIQKTNNIYLDDLIKKLLIEKPYDKNKNNCRISWEDYFNHNFFKNDYKNEIKSFKISLEKFNNTIHEMIKFIKNKLDNFNDLINNEIKNIFTDQYNENIKKFSNLLKNFNFNNDENKFNEMFEIINNNSILNFKIKPEKKIKKTQEEKTFRRFNTEFEKIIHDKNGNVKEYDNGKLIFEGNYLNGKRYSGKVYEYYDNGKLKFEGEYLSGKKWIRK